MSQYVNSKSLLAGNPKLIMALVANKSDLEPEREIKKEVFLFASTFFPRCFSFYNKKQHTAGRRAIC